MECHSVWLSTRRHYAAGVGHRGSRTIQRSGDLSSCFVVHRHRTYASHCRHFYKIGPAGFEPATCRRGDRSTKLTWQVHPDLFRFCNSAPCLRLRDESKSSRCAATSMARRGASLSNGRNYDVECVDQDSHTIQHNGALSYCS